MLTESWPETKLGARSKDAEPPVKVSGRRAAHGEFKNLRQQALSSAIFYSECTLNNISQGGATNAEDIARSHQSKWWLPGDDPRHPSLQFLRSKSDDGCKASPRCKTDDDFITASDSDAIQEKPIAPHRASTDLGEENGIADDDIDITLEENGVNAPLFARDDDLGTIASLHFLQKTKSSASNTQGYGESLRAQKPKTTSASIPKCNGKRKDLRSMFGATEDVTRSHYLCSSIHGPSRKQKRCQPKHKSITDDTNPTKSGLNSSMAIISSAPLQRSTHDEVNIKYEIKTAKIKLLASLEVDCPGIDNPDFLAALATLEKLYQSQMPSTAMSRPSKKAKKGLSYIEQHTSMDGTWLMISPPSYPSCLGVNENGERMFTLGRMTFDMFHPADLICTIQQQLNIIKTVHKDETLPIYIPPSLRQEVENNHSKDSFGNLKTHNIIASFTIEKPPHISSNPGQVHQRKLRGILTNYGYTLPDPHNPNRNSIWFTSGTIEPVDGESLEDWKACFGEEDSCASSRTQYTAKARSLASTILLGAVSEPMDEDGTKGYFLKRPIGGHGYAYCDVIFMDEEVRIMRGHSGSVFVFRRVEVND
ncbi:hypothetical protein ACHAW6_011730 [Cyclotella cf. meneghiniana]